MDSILHVHDKSGFQSEIYNRSIFILLQNILAKVNPYENEVPW